MVASRNDEYMSFAKAEALSHVWGSGFVDLGHAGHINVASGFGHWPDGAILASSLHREPAVNPNLPGGLPAPRPFLPGWAAFKSIIQPECNKTIRIML
ncbi:alpha/beta hydrolase [Brucella abortus]|nr:alpha/beta hydrolase [Brucella abortus]